jgi:hypothetical protein
MLSLKEEIYKFLQNISLDIQREQIAQGRYVTGKTARSLEPEVDDTGGILYGSSSVNVLETGRKPGKVPEGFQGVIRQWMRDRGLFQAETASRQNSIAYLIARKISREGTLLHRQGGNSGILSKAITEARITEFERAVLNKYGREVQNDLFTTFTK